MNTLRSFHVRLADGGKALERGRKAWQASCREPEPTRRQELLGVCERAAEAIMARLPSVSYEFILQAMTGAGGVKVFCRGEDADIYCDEDTWEKVTKEGGGA